MVIITGIEMRIVCVFVLQLMYSQCSDAGCRTLCRAFHRMDGAREICICLRGYD